MIKKLLVPIDGSKNANKALLFACQLAEKFESEIFLIHVANPPAEEQFLAMGSSISSIDLARREIEDSAKQLIDEATEVISSHQCTLLRSDIVIGNAAQEILRYSKKHMIDTIVMGSRGLSNFSSMLLGSVSHNVGNHAECSCITVR